MEHQLSPLIHMGFKFEEIPPLYIHVDARIKEQIRLRLEAQGIKDSFLLIHPAAAFATKQWSIEGFATVADELGKEGIPCLATAGPGQEGTAGGIGLKIKTQIIDLSSR